MKFAVLTIKFNLLISAASDQNKITCQTNQVNRYFSLLTDQTNLWSAASLLHPVIGGRTKCSGRFNIS